MNGVGICIDPTSQGLCSVHKSILPFSINKAALNYLASRPLAVLPPSSASCVWKTLAGISCTWS